MRNAVRSRGGWSHAAADEWDAPVDFVTVDARLGEWRRRHTDALAALLFGAVQLVVLALAMPRSWFGADDLVASARAAGSAPGWSYLTQTVHGQVSPGGQLLGWLLTRAAPLHHGIAVAVCLVGQAVADYLIYRAYREAVAGRGRPASLVVLAWLFALSTVLVAASPIAALLGEIPLEALLAVAAAATLRWRAGGKPRPLWIAAAAVVLALGFDAQAVLAAGVVIGVVLTSQRDTGGFRRLLRRCRPVQLMLLAAVGYVAARLITTIAAAAPDLPGLAWRWTGAGSAGLEPRPGIGLLWVILAAIVLGATAFIPAGVRSWRAAIAVAGYLLGLALLRTVGVGDPHPGGVLAVSILTATVVTTALSQPPRAEATSSISWRRPAVQTVASLTAVVVIGSLGAAAIVRVGSQPARRYVAAARASAPLVPPGAALVDGRVPRAVLPAADPDSDSAQLLLRPLGVLPSPLTAAASIVTVASSGRLVQARVAGALNFPVPGGGCGYHAGPQDFSIPLSSALPDGSWVVQVSYIASPRPGTLVLRAGRTTVAAPLQPGIHDVFARVRGTVSAVTIRQAGPPGASMCTDEIAVGTAVPLG